MSLVALVSSSFVSSVYWLFLTSGFLFGLGGNFYHISGILLVQRYFKKRRSLATGIFATSSSFSAMLGPLYKFLIDGFGWRKTFWICGLWFLVPFVLVLVLYSLNVKDGMTKTEDTDEDERVRTTCCSKISCNYWNSWFTIGVVGIVLQSVALYTPLLHMVRLCFIKNMYITKKMSPN